MNLIEKNIYYIVKRSSYLSDLDYVNVESLFSSKISGNSVNKNINESILSSIGEFFERKSMNMDEKRLTIPAISMRENKGINFQKEFLLKKGVLLDSCGIASHTCPHKAYINALMEFIERQSLVYNYLSKQKAYKIKWNDEKLFNIPNKFKKCEFYNISIIKSCFVILAIYSTKENFYIGLGTSTDINVAMQKSLKELNQFYVSEYYFPNDESVIDYDKKIQDYSDIFSMLTIDELKTAYNYLNESKILYVKNGLKKDINNVLFELYDVYKIDPYIMLYDNFRRNSRQIIMKVFDLNWFPNMNPRTFSEEHYKFVEKVTKANLDRECNLIPFP